MDSFHPAEDSAAVLVERRWFAAERAISGVQAECDELAKALDRVQSAWHSAQTRLLQLETLRDALDDELAAMDGQPVQPFEIQKSAA